MQVNIYKHEEVHTIQSRTQIGIIKIVDDSYEEDDCATCLMRYCLTFVLKEKVLVF